MKNTGSFPLERSHRLRACTAARTRKPPTCVISTTPVVRWLLKNRFRLQWADAALAVSVQRESLGTYTRRFVAMTRARWLAATRTTSALDITNTTASNGCPGPTAISTLSAHLIMRAGQN